MDTIALTYKELAERLNIKPESARKTAQRRRWRRTNGNDGTVRVHVPVEALNAPRDNTGDSPTDTNPVHAQIARLSAELDGVRELLSAERRARDQAEADRDAWRSMAQRPWWKRLAG